MRRGRSPAGSPRSRTTACLMALAALLVVLAATPASQAVREHGGAAFRIREYRVPAGEHPHDVAPARDGGVWYTAQHSVELGWLDPRTGTIKHIPLGESSAPHGVIVGPDGAPWITDGGLNAIV